MKDSYKKDDIPFAMVARDLLNDPEISLKAKGVYSFMYSKKDDWNFTIKSMKSQLKEGYRGISSALQELKDKGWVTYCKKSDGSGQYHLHIKPKPQNEVLGESQNHVLAECGNSIIAKRDRISNIDNINNIDFTSNKENILKENSDSEFDLFGKPQKKEKEKKVSGQKKERVFNYLVNQCFDRVVVLFPENTRPRTKQQVLAWKNTLHQLNTIEKIDFEIIYIIVEKMRKDAFWSRNFLSLLKLRKQNKDQIKYIYVFAELIKSNNQNGNTEPRVGRQTKSNWENNKSGWG